MNTTERNRNEDWLESSGYRRVRPHTWAREGWPCVTRLGERWLAGGTLHLTAPAAVAAAAVSLEKTQSGVDADWLRANGCTLENRVWTGCLSGVKVQAWFASCSEWRARIDGREFVHAESAMQAVTQALVAYVSESTAESNAAHKRANDATAALASLRTPPPPVDENAAWLESRGFVREEWGWGADLDGFAVHVRDGWTASVDGAPFCPPYPSARAAVAHVIRERADGAWAALDKLGVS